jgi:cytochrome c oxidase assembly protein subunit 15
VSTIAYAIRLLRRSPERRVGIAAWALVGTVILQVALGISTLVLEVPVALAAAHQACALTLFGIALFIVHESGGPEAAPGPERTEGEGAGRDTELVTV